ncbi:immunoglobulin-like domain-containing protein [Listeria seeligeri]|uniref:immunoglobulin-like domain-containing protein n=1 Tax=Listeria seeligeri TaxID=1640 RepID=UPI0022EBE7FD|nr:immunoglobulin-like domain-containing protein [Listeria seeligeri]
MKENNKIVKSTAAIFLILMTTIPFNTSSFQANAVSTTKETKVQVAVAPAIALENGSFEEPVISSSRHYQIFNSSQVPGWQTTDSQNRIEFQSNGFLESTSNQAQYAQSGNQWVELNAYENAALYQDVPTTPGTTMHWQVYHKGREGVDVSIVEFGSPGETLIEQSEMSDGNTEWGLYTGTYTIPEGQTTTRFQFRAISSTGGDPGLGNYLDNIQFATPSVLELVGTFSEPSIQVKDGVDYHLQATNTGGMPAANNTFSIKIPAELSYTPGSLTSADATISEESYDEATRTLTFKTNTIEKDATINITISLVGEVVTPAATPDTTVTYNDENFDEESYTADATDASVEITSNEMPVITGDTSTTLQPGDTFDPMSTIGATDLEDSDLTSEVEVTSNPVNTDVPGTYEVTYEVTDSDGNTADYTRTVIVTDLPVM